MKLNEYEHLRTKKNDKNSYGLQHAKINLNGISKNVRLLDDEMMEEEGIEEDYFSVNEEFDLTDLSLINI